MWNCYGKDDWLYFYLYECICILFISLLVWLSLNCLRELPSCFIHWFQFNANFGFHAYILYLARTNWISHQKVHILVNASLQINSSRSMWHFFFVIVWVLMLLAFAPYLRSEIYVVQIACKFPYRTGRVAHTSFPSGFFINLWW